MAYLTCLVRLEDLVGNPGGLSRSPSYSGVTLVATHVTLGAKKRGQVTPCGKSAPTTEQFPIRMAEFLFAASTSYPDVTRRANNENKAFFLAHFFSEIAESAHWKHRQREKTHTLAGRRAPFHQDLNL